MLVSVVDQTLEDADAHDAAAPHDHAAAVLSEVLVHVLVIFIGVDDRGHVVVPRAVLLEIGQEAETRVAHRHVHEPAPDCDTSCLRTAQRRGVHRDVAAATSAADDSGGALEEYRRPVQPGHLAVDRLEDLTRHRGVVVRADRLVEHVPHGLQRIGDARPTGRTAKVAIEGFTDRVARKPPDVVHHRSRVGADAFELRDLGVLAQVLICLVRDIDVGDGTERIGADAGDSQQVVEREAPHATADRDERDVMDRDAGLLDHRVSPDRRVEHALVEVTARALGIATEHASNDGVVGVGHRAVSPFSSSIARASAAAFCQRSVGSAAMQRSTIARSLAVSCADAAGGVVSTRRTATSGSFGGR